MKEYEWFNRCKSGRFPHNWLLVVSLVLMTCFSCKEKEQPQNVLPPAEMVKILGDLYVTEEMINKLNVDRDSSTKAFDYLDNKIFEKYGIADTLFKRSLNYYLERPDEIEKIYSAVIDSLNLREQRLSIPEQ